MVEEAKNAQRKLCPGCQADLDIDERTCPYCSSKQLTRFEIVIQRFIRSISPKVTPATRFLLLINIMMFVIITADTVMQQDFALVDAFFSPPGELIKSWGAHLQGDFVWWRMITANFVHIGIIHIVFNMMALRYVGPYVERTFGSAMTFASFVLLGTISMCVSNLTGALFESQAIVAGASGAIMALIAMAGIAAHKEHTTFSLKIRNSMLTAAAATIIFGIIVNRSVGHGIDNVAHIAGLISGLITGLLIPKQNATGFTKCWHFRLSYLLCFVSFSLVCVSFGFMTCDQNYEKYSATCIRDLKIKDYPKAVISCEKARKADSNKVEGWNRVILAHALSRDFDKATQLCTKAQAHFKKSEDSQTLDALCYQITNP